MFSFARTCARLSLDSTLHSKAFCEHRSPHNMLRSCTLLDNSCNFNNQSNPLSVQKATSLRGLVQSLLIIHLVGSFDLSGQGKDHLPRYLRRHGGWITTFVVHRMVLFCLWSWAAETRKPSWADKFSTLSDQPCQCFFSLRIGILWISIGVKDWQI